MTVRYIDAPAAGTEDGSSWANAGDINDLLAFYQASVPGDEIWIAADATHARSGGITLTNANNPTASAPIKVRGMRPDGTDGGYPEKATLIGGRSTPWVAGGTGGNRILDLGAGVEHTWFSDLLLMNYGSAFRLSSSDNVGIRMQDIEAVNVGFGLEHLAGGGTTVTDLRVRRFNVYGFTTNGFLLSNASSDIVFEDCDVWSLGQNDASASTAPVGFKLNNSVSGVRYRRCKAIGGFDVRATSSYWQGDGFTSEELCDDITLEDCYSADWGDGGYDTKASNAILRRCTAERNKRNFRFHKQTLVGGPTIVEDGISRYPMWRGGTGPNPVHVDLADGVGGATTAVIWRSVLGRSLIEDHDPATIVVNHGGVNTSLDMRDARLRLHPSATLQSGGSTATFTDCVTETEA